MLIDTFEAKKILAASKKGEEEFSVNFDLGFTKKVVFLKKNLVVIDDQPFELSIFKKMAKSNAVYELGKPSMKIAIFDESYYKLSPVLHSAPTIEIDGIRMHRTKDLTPLEDAQAKIRLIDIKPRENILDVCTGLGYTAIEAYQRKAKVTTIEIEENVIAIAKKNPYSQELFQGIAKQEITLIIGNAFSVVKKFKDESFDAILNDPPRFSLSGELYSEEFYRELYRILKQNGRLFHYVGTPGAKYRKKDFMKGVKNRLRNVGFKLRNTEDNESAFAYKN